MNHETSSPWLRLVQRIAPRLRFPQLFLLLLGLFLVDLFIPDPLPFIDEVLLGVLTVLMGTLRQREPPVDVGSSDVSG